MMIMDNDKIIQLPSKGRLIVVTDLHGDYEDYRKYLNLWDGTDKYCHIVFTGDLIHSPYPTDQSVEILDDAISKSKNYSNFHVLLGNHELSHITGVNIIKMDKNLRRSFEELIINKKGNLQPTLDKYIDYFKKLPLFLKTNNGLFISHAGPSKNISSMDDIKKLSSNNYKNPLLHDFLWNRYRLDYNESDVSDFLEIVESNFMVKGHDMVDGYKIYGKQLILSSSFQTSNKMYLNIDLTKKMENIHDLTDCLEFLE